jgi:uncharacterized coiled-coil protein SlyX
MPIHERELAERANAELLRQIEERLAHSRDVIAQINEVLGQRHANLRRSSVEKAHSKWVN